jgi:hypothetical protein
MGDEQAPWLPVASTPGQIGSTARRGAMDISSMAKSSNNRRRTLTHNTPISRPRNRQRENSPEDPGDSIGNVMAMMMMSQAQDRDERQEESVQLRGAPGDLSNRTTFRDFVVNVQQFRVYLVMLWGQTHVSMIHTPGVYYSIASTTSTYQIPG